MSIYILNISTYDGDWLGEWCFSAQDKGADFIRRNFATDAPRIVSNHLWEGKTNHYMLEEIPLDQHSI